MKTIIGIDPGLASTGYGIVGVKNGQTSHVAHGVITTEVSADTAMRLSIIYNKLKSILDIYKPDEACVEDIYFAKNAKTFIGVAQAKGVLMLALAERGLTVREYTPLVIKRAVAGNGRAEKAQVQELVRIILNLKEAPTPDHAADALAAAICHSHQSTLRRLIEAGEKRRV